MAVEDQISICKPVGMTQTEFTKLKNSLKEFKAKKGMGAAYTLKMLIKEYKQNHKDEKD